MRNEAVVFDEGRYSEFKEVKGTNPADSIKNTADEYVMAFLDGAGGSIYWGICNDDSPTLSVRIRARANERPRVVSRCNVWTC